ncbi:GGDEF domain-containing protein [Raoultella terrigena]|uniref:GGDEF domain-containing protein n=1 Tax=Raoultella terrigena TaxID=577 RepID=UPI000E0E9AAF
MGVSPAKRTSTHENAGSPRIVQRLSRRGHPIFFLNAFRLYQKSNHKYEDTYQNSIRDYLTQLFNRRYFYHQLAIKIQQAAKKNPLSIILCDIDHFKRINDKYGYYQGDLVIQYVAWVLQDRVRSDDIVARTGGETNANRDDCPAHHKKATKGTLSPLLPFDFLHPPQSR